MLRAALRDVQWRSPRLIVGVVAAAVLFGVTLMFQGLSISLDTEADATLDAVGADLWFTTDTVSGPLTGVSILEASAVDEVRALPGVDRADPLVLVRDAITGPRTETVIVIGHEPDGLGSPDVVDGRSAEAPFEAVVDRSSGLALDDHFGLAGREFTVVGRTRGRSFTGGTPSVYVRIADAQTSIGRGLDVVTAVVANGDSSIAPPGTRRWTTTEVRDDLLRPAGKIIDSLNLVKYLLWLAAACVIGSLVYLATRERVRDFALFKTVGVPSARVVAATVAQAVVITGAAAIGGIIGAYLMAPRFPIPLVVPGSAVAISCLFAVVVSVLAGVTATGVALRTDPAVAFGRA